MILREEPQDEDFLTTLRALAASGLSARQVALQFGLTRGQVAGMAYRAKPRITWSHAGKMGRPGNKNRANSAKNGSRKPHHEGERNNPAERAQTIERNITPELIGIMELNDERCRWPYGSGPYRFCGCVVCGATYCLGHKQIAVRNFKREPRKKVTNERWMY